MTQNIEQRTLAATATMEGAAKAVDEIANTDKDVSTPVGTRKSFPKISREWDNESQRLQQEWQSERNELSTKALGVKLWESGVSEANINQQRRWTDNYTYLPKTVPALMAAEGPDDNWIPYTADKSDTLNDIFGRKPVDLVGGVILVPDANLNYPKINAFGKVWELEDGNQQLTVQSFIETEDGYLIITLDDASQRIAHKMVGASREYVAGIVGQLGDEVIGGKTWPVRSGKSAEVGDDIPLPIEFLRVAGTLYPMSSQVSGEISAINIVALPYTAIIGGETVYLLDHRYYSRATTHVAAFWVVGAGDETESIKQAIVHAERTDSLLQWESRKYSYSEPLVAKHISIAFNGATMNYTGPIKKISFTWVSKDGNEESTSRMDDVTFLNENAALPIEVSNTQTVSIPELPVSSVISSIGGSTAVEVDVPVSGVEIDDMIHVSYESSNQFIGLTARCEQNGVITLFCSNYDYQTIPSENISITFTIMKNPIHGICIGGSMPSANKIRVVGYTGLSVGIGDGIAPVSGVKLTGERRAYYGTFTLQVSAAYGYGLEIPARNNANRFYFNTFPYNLYNDALPRRACTYHQLILGGVSNTFGRLCLESASSKEAMLVAHWANANEVENGYYEENSSWVNDNEAKVRLAASSSANTINIRGLHLKSVDDFGVDNDVNIIPSYYINGGGSKQPIASNSLLYNGDFINGMNNWTNWGTATDLSVIDSPFGKALRAVLDQESINLEQSIDNQSGSKVAYTAGVWVRTDIEGIGIYHNGTTNGQRHDGDSEWQYLSSTAHISDLSHIQVRSAPGVSNLTGFVEIALVSIVQGRTPFLPSPTEPEGIKTYSPPSIHAGGFHSLNIDVTGAKTGDFVTPSLSGDLLNCLLFGNVNAADVVTITIFNPTSSAVDLGSQTFKCIVRAPKR